MKYRYSFIVEDTAKDQEILVIKETGVARSKETCLKNIRKDITQAITKYLINRNAHMVDLEQE